MTNVVRFPVSSRIEVTTSSKQVTTIPREEFERLAELALDVVDRIVALLDEADGDPEAEDGGDLEPSLGTPIGRSCQLIWADGGDRDIERP